MSKARFPTTRWTLIASSRGDLDARRQALAELMSAYWQPLYCYARRRGIDREPARDVIQGFLTHLLERDFVARLDPERGRLRSYLKTALSNYISAIRARETRIKRGGAGAPIPLDFDVAESELSSTPMDAEQAYDRAWAARVIGRALDKLESEYRSGERKGPFDVIRKSFGFGVLPPHAEVADEHGMTVSQLKSMLHRARRRFRALLLEEVADTVHGTEEAVDEAESLLELLY